MSYDVSLLDDNENCVSVEKHSEGGTYVLGGTSRAALNVTYNYGSFYREHLDAEQGLRWLDGKSAQDCIERLAHAVASLGTERSEDYWEATAGNAGYALSILYRWARQYPDAIFCVG